MVISVGSDHAGYGLKVKMIPYLESLGHTIIDNGNNGAEDVVFFPEVARAVCRPVLEGTVGASVACNKIPGIRASIVHDYQCAHQCVEHDHVNVMCIGEKVVGEWLAKDLLKAFLEAAGDTDERTAHVIQLLAQMDQRQ